MKLNTLLILMYVFSLAPAVSVATLPNGEGPVTVRRVANIYLAEAFINEQLQKFTAKSHVFKNLHLDMEPKKDYLYLTGILKLPLDQFQAAKLDQSQTEFRFQLAILPRATKDGHLKLEFPLSETYFYQARSKNPERDKVIVPVHLLSLAVASMRGYLAALSGDFSSFQKKMSSTKKEIGKVRRLITKTQDPEKLIDLKLQQQALSLELKSQEVEKLQLERTAKSLANILGFLGQDLNLNNEILASENSITLKVNMGKIVPYLKEVTLAGVRVSHDAKDGDGEDYFVVGVDSALDMPPVKAERRPRTPRQGMKIPPSLLIKINQAVFNSKAIKEAQKDKIGDVVQDLDVALQEDGVHVTGKIKKYFLKIPFDTTVDFVSTRPDVFEVRLKELRVKGVDLKFLTKYVLDAIKEKLDKALEGICTFQYLGDIQDSQVLQVTVEPKNLVPAFPDLHLVGVDVGPREFWMKIGHTEGDLQ